MADAARGVDSGGFATERELPELCAARLAGGATLALQVPTLVLTGPAGAQTRQPGLWRHWRRS